MTASRVFPLIYPAIDLKDGQCVRLLRGDMAAAKTYNPDPAAQARAFEQAGFPVIHVVDLNGAFEGRSVNQAAVRAILDGLERAVVQLGGGIRDMATIDSWLDAGVDRVILGTVAVQNPDLVRAACARHPGRVIAGIDAKAGWVATHGWADTSQLRATDLARRMADAGVAAIIHTDIDRDGALEGVNAEASRALAQAAGIPVIASGGVAGLDDIARVRDAGLSGVIVGRAIYEGRIALEDARRMMNALV